MSARFAIVAQNILYTADTIGTVWMRVYVGGELCCVIPLHREAALALADYILDHLDDDDDDDGIGTPQGSA